MTDTAQLAERIGATLEGAPAPVTLLLPPGHAAPGAVIVCEDEATLQKALGASSLDTLAAIVVSTGAEVPGPHPPLLRHDAPRVAFARISAILDQEAAPPVGIDSSAHVAPSARIAASAAIGPNVVIGEGSEVGEDVILDAGCILGDGVHVGAHTRLFPRVVVYRGVRIGTRVRIHAGAILGADGFGYAPGPRGAEKIHHLGTVVIEDDVEIGAHTCIDRATLGETRIGAGSKLDNLIQVGHNVQIGQHCLIAGTVAIGGSTRIGNGVRIGGGARIADHLTIHDGAALAGGAGLSKDIPPGEAWGGFPAAPMREFVRERYLIHRLERIWNFVRAADRPKAAKTGDAEDAAS